MLGISSCKKETDPPVDLQYEYYPTEIGFYKIYNVDSIIINEAFPELSDTLNYQVKQLFESEYIDNLNRKNIRVEHFYRKDASQDWKLLKAFSTIRDNNFAEVMDNNTRILVMKFPVKENQTWNRNAFNSNDANETKIENVIANVSAGSVSYSNCAQLSLSLDTNLVTYLLDKEYYAKNIGLVKKEYMNFESSKNISTPTVLNRIENGYSYKYELIEYGKN